MRLTLWLLGLAGVAVAAALLLGSHQGTVTLFIAPYRVDLSLNLVLLGLLLSFALGHLALRGVAALFALPQQARRWRLQQKERATQTALLDALAQLMTGRYLRARKSAQQALGLVQHLLDSDADGPSPNKSLPQLRALAHLIAAESAHALRDRATRDQHLNEMLLSAGETPTGALAEAVDAARLSAARWALSERDTAHATQWLDALPQGTARRTLALRLRQKTDRLSGHNLPALSATRLLAKHGAFAPGPAQSLVRSLAIACLDDCRDASQLLTTWNLLEPAERQMDAVTVHAANRLLQLDGDAQQALLWLQPVWQHWASRPDAWTPAQCERLVSTLAQAFQKLPPDTDWLTRIEHARTANPRNVELQYLSGMVCAQHALWGKAQQMLDAAAPRLSARGLQRNAWRKLAELAEQRGDTAQALQHWKRAAY